MNELPTEPVSVKISYLPSECLSWKYLIDSSPFAFQVRPICWSFIGTIALTSLYSLTYWVIDNHSKITMSNFFADTIYYFFYVSPPSVPPLNVFLYIWFCLTLLFLIIKSIARLNNIQASHIQLSDSHFSIMLPGHKERDRALKTIRWEDIVSAKLQRRKSFIFDELVLIIKHCKKYVFMGNTTDPVIREFEQKISLNRIRFSEERMGFLSSLRRLAVNAEIQPNIEKAVKYLYETRAQDKPEEVFPYTPSVRQSAIFQNFIKDKEQTLLLIYIALLMVALLIYEYACRSDPSPAEQIMINSSLQLSMLVLTVAIIFKTRLVEIISDLLSFHKPKHILVSDGGISMQFCLGIISYCGPLIPWDSIHLVAFSETDKKKLGVSFSSNNFIQSLSYAFISNGFSSKLFHLNLDRRCLFPAYSGNNFQDVIQEHLPASKITGIETKESYKDKSSHTELWLKSFQNTVQVASSKSLLSGATLKDGHYKIIDKIGIGGQGTAYTATELSGSTIVLKEFILPSNSNTHVKRQILENIAREAELLQNINSPNIVACYDSFVDNLRAYLVLEHIDGKSLRAMVENDGKKPQSLPEPLAITYALQMCDILNHLHSLESPIIHRDFTPENLIVSDTTKQLKLIDFNVAQQLESSRTNTIVGKHAYIPPEQFRGKATCQSDIYALGATLFFLLTGEDPEPITTSHPKSKNSNVSDQLNSIVAKCTQTDPANRYQNISELHADLAKLEDCINIEIVEPSRELTS